MARATCSWPWRMCPTYAMATQPSAKAFCPPSSKITPSIRTLEWPICRATSSAAPCRSTEPVNVADRAYFLSAMETRGFAIGEFQIGRITEKATISFGYPILDADGRVQAVVAAAMDLAWLNQLMADAELPEGALLLVIDRNGTILVRLSDSRGVDRAI